MTAYFRPIPMQDATRPANARSIACGWCWFDRAERITRDGARELVGIAGIPADVLERITAPRTPMAGLTFEAPHIMGILNVTPDSFSDGGDFIAPDAAVARARKMVATGADMIDIGGESTRPGADFVPVDEEIRRTAPVIKAIRAELATPISIDTRKAPVAHAALEAGANLINDVAAFTHDPALAEVASKSGGPVCLMHAQGDPETMQNDPRYDDVLLDVFDFLSERINAAVAAGIPRNRIMVDPGIGFGKTMQHNLTLLRDISLFHALGCPVLLGASRKKFIGVISGAESAKDRVSGSVSVALHAIGQGVQVVRVHDIEATRQAISLQTAIWGQAE
ncbi:MAG TPA: dihydropteroate synthase [Rhodobacteraceae bacterium]|nr:dihydropteroate synthase [Paracoccaceae bacterium]